jgi:hypothetical protein
VSGIRRWRCKAKVEKRVLGICLTLCHAEWSIVLVALDETQVDEKLAR